MLLPKKEKIKIKKNRIFFILLIKKIDCGYSLEPPRRGGSNEYHNLFLWAEIRTIIYIPVNPSFTVSKWGLRGSTLYRHVVVMICCYARQLRIRHTTPANASFRITSLHRLCRKAIHYKKKKKKKKHAYSNKLKMLPPKKANFKIKQF